MNPAALRRKNLRAYVAKALGGNNSELARLTGRKPWFFTDVFAGRKSFGEKLARALEVELHLPPSALDRPLTDEELAKPLASVIALHAPWPFSFARERFDRLTPTQQANIDGRIATLIELFEQEAEARGKKTAQIIDINDYRN